ncbi:hypothetical protein [Burkholderia latens]|uniref:hypothetical protein n=1 Tax=Burkholderia latens TaxID=488446 RepID=UPI001AEA9DB2|nr:hypothetical protein [Burkholderia latens]QTO52646.1 hypothetical protein J8I86_29555 [Burkholderia latens]
MNPSAKNVITLIVIAVGYVIAVIVGTADASNSSTSLTTLVVDNSGSRCEFDNVYIGDGSLRVRKHCNQISREGLSNAQD